MALAIGLNREITAGCLSDSECEHRYRLWWVLYIIDVKFSVNMGSPILLRQDDTEFGLPVSTQLGSDKMALGIHVSLAQLAGDVVSGTKFYAPNITLGSL